eukprot:CAMPEP_0172769456 /NCGR_PEP_ID=MMETSP1074-20121228/186701_1 /TAXON_ID=2916 /ORGANISM="Ceratium fusus, Strain PA161109" /LENGTH=129 /DNA_ID=CAMNT_0013605037 /DNA_START=45 /DNA_END=430 /DNA_ORIENTATION=+
MSVKLPRVATAAKTTNTTIKADAALHEELNNVESAVKCTSSANTATVESSKQLLVVLWRFHPTCHGESGHVSGTPAVAEIFCKPTMHKRKGCRVHMKAFVRVRDSAHGHLSSTLLRGFCHATVPFARPQ